ncbi:MAG: 2-dehydropantoate 2-reductase [Gammaproteobacteria bacterium]|jgi:2-dehydropantoate 2-reductase
MKICIFGMGAIGGHYAAKLAAAGHDVSVVARGANLEKTKRDEITVRSGDEVFSGRVTGSDNPADLGAQDVVISTLKANSLPALAAGIGPLLGPDTPVVFAQNGLPWWYDMGLPTDRPKPADLSRLDADGALHRAVARERVIGAVINSPNEVVEPGVVKHTNPKRNALLIGEVDDSQTERINELRGVLAGANIESPTVPNLRFELWSKLMLNMTGSMISLLTGHQISVVRKEPAIGDLFRALASEATAIASAHGVDLSATFNAENVIKNAPDHTPSIRQDYNLGRPMELDSMLVVPMAFARVAGVPTPNLDAVTALAVLKAKDKGLYTS